MLAASNYIIIGADTYFVIAVNNSNNLSDQFINLLSPEVSALTQAYYKNQRISKALSDIASSKKLKTAIERSGGVDRIRDALTKHGYLKLNNAVKEVGGQENLDTAIDLLKVKDTDKSLPKSSSGDKWEQIQLYKKDPKALEWYLGKLNSRSLVAFAKKAESNGDKSLKDKLNALIKKRKKNVQEAINQRVQVNFRLTEEETTKIEEIQKWLKDRENISLLNQDLNVKKLDTATSLSRELLKISIEYLYLASLNSRQINALSEMIVYHKQFFEEECSESWDRDTYPNDVYEDEDGAYYNFKQYQKLLENRKKTLIIQTASIHFEIPEKLIENDFWDIAEKRADQIIKQLEDGEPLDKVSRLRSSILKDFMD